MKDNVVVEKSYQFSLRIIQIYLEITKERKEFVLSKQLLRSGTSVGANIEEAIGAQSKADFLSKLSIAYKEARESRYWIRLLRDSRFLFEQVSDELLEQCNEIMRILSSIILSTKENMQKEIQ